jgi:thymidylate kinase
MKIVLAIEGVDGSGKSSLAEFIQAICQDHDTACTLIGRRVGYVSPAVVKLSQILREEVRHLSAQADVFIRLAREYQRAHLAAMAPQGIVLLDRFVLTVLSLARLYGQEGDLLTHYLRETVARADLWATIFVHCPFEVACQRVLRRRPGKSPHKLRNQTMLRRVADFMVKDFKAGLITGQQWLVDNSRTLPEAEEQVAGYLLPYLQKSGVIST